MKTKIFTKLTSVLAAGVIIVGVISYIGFRQLASHAASNAPKGNGNDSITCSALNGWTYDPDRPTQSLRVDIYFTHYANALTGRDPGLGVYTNIYRPDVNAAFGITGNHGYSFQPPNQVQGVTIRNNQTWNVFIYAIGVDANGNGDGQNPQIGQGQLNCSPIPPPPPPPPPPAPKPPPTPAPTPKPAPKASSSSAGKSSTSSSASSSSSSATPSLTMPANFTANPSVVGAILNWNLSSGGSGDIHYEVDRSTDQTTWDSVATSIVGSTYADSTTNFSTLYYYRVHAVDSNGVTSDYATSQVTTGNYNSDVSAGTTQSITSDDGLATITIPTAALATDAVCAVVAQTTNGHTGTTTKTQSVVVGPYLLICRDSSGTVIDRLNGNLGVSLKVSLQVAAHFTGFMGATASANSTSFTAVKPSNYDARAHSVSFSVSGAQSFAVTAHPKTNLSLYIEIIVTLVVIGGLITVGVRKREAIIEWFYAR